MRLRSHRCLLAFLLSALLLGGASAARADDVPANIRASYDEAQALLARGDAKKAYSAISKGRAKNPESVDFWVLYVRIWRALEKPEDTLWEKIVAPLEKKLAGSALFDVVRMRLATTPAERITHLEAAMAKEPARRDLRALLVDALAADGQEDRAEELLDAILKEDPDDADALVLKGSLMIASGYSRSAVEFARERLETRESPGLRDVIARALLQVAQNDASVLDEAFTEAKKAVDARPDPAFVLTAVTILEQQEKIAEAVALLREHHGRTSDADLGAALGRLAFRVGDYEAAVKGLAPKAQDDARSAQALVLAFARRGKAKEARAALEVARRHEEATPAWAAAIELTLGDAAAALRRLEGAEGDEALHVRARAHAWKGDAAAAQQAATGKAEDGSRGAEEWLLPVVQARLLVRLGPKADAVRKQVLDARWAAGAAKVAEATLPDGDLSENAPEYASARHVNFMVRYPTYHRSLTGRWLPEGGFLPIVPTLVEGGPAVGVGVVSKTECPREGPRLWAFNPVKLGGSSVTLNVTPPQDEEAWKTASEAFARGCGALLGGEATAAAEAFGKVLEVEPDWHRARLFQGAALAIGGDAAQGAPLVRAAAERLPDDWEGRLVGILVRALADEQVGEEARRLGERLEAYSPRRFEEL